MTSDVNRNIKRLELLELEVFSGGLSLKRNTLTKPGKLGLCLLEDLTTLAAGCLVTRWFHSAVICTRLA